MICLVSVIVSAAEKKNDLAMAMAMAMYTTHAQRDLHQLKEKYTRSAKFDTRSAFESICDNINKHLKLEQHGRLEQTNLRVLFIRIIL